MFREINERIEDLNVSFSAVTETGEWICECANETCLMGVSMSVTEYEAVRSEGTRFFVAPGDEHVWPDVERVVDRLDRYWIVETFGRSAELAQQADPRSEPPAVIEDVSRVRRRVFRRLTGIELVARG